MEGNKAGKIFAVSVVLSFICRAFLGAVPLCAAEVFTGIALCRTKGLEAAYCHSPSGDGNFVTETETAGNFSKEDSGVVAEEDRAESCIGGTGEEKGRSGAQNTEGGRQAADYIKDFADLPEKSLYGYGSGEKSEKGSAYAAKNPAERKEPKVIFIDPGHGGLDTGAEAKAIESDVINETCRILFSLLKEDPDFTPVMSRGKDEDPDSGERACRAKNAGRDLLLSVHANSDSSPSSRGFECFPTPPGREFHSRSMDFARALVRRMSRAGRKIRGKEGEKGIKFAYYFPGGKKIVESGDLKVRTAASFGVLEKSPCPAVLAEQCFLTNRRDVEAWTGEDGCRRAAEAYYRAIRDYFGPGRK